MPYFTVVIIDTKTRHEKTHRGIKAANSKEALESITQRLDMGRHDYRVWMSKWRTTHYSFDSEWTQGRQRHEGRTSMRSFWAVLSRRGRRAHTQVLCKDINTVILKQIQLAMDECKTLHNPQLKAFLNAHRADTKVTVPVSA